MRISERVCTNTRPAMWVPPGWRVSVACIGRCVWCKGTLCLCVATGFPPGPVGDQAVGMLSGPLEFISRLRREHGPVVGMLLGGERVVLVSEPQAARQVLLEQPDVFVKVGSTSTPCREQQGAAGARLVLGCVHMSQVCCLYSALSPMCCSFFLYCRLCCSAFCLTFRQCVWPLIYSCHISHVIVPPSVLVSCGGAASAGVSAGTEACLVQPADGSAHNNACYCTTMHASSSSLLWALQLCDACLCLPGPPVLDACVA